MRNHLVVPPTLLLLLASWTPALAGDKSDLYLEQSRGVGDPEDLDAWRKGEQRGGLAPYPEVKPGTPNPPDGLHRYGGGARNSFGTPVLDEPFADWMARMSRQRPAVDRAARESLTRRFELSCRTDPKATMSRNKPLPVGPTARLP
ncbi:MAG TPA: hypothetical protein VLQ93_03815, partial [Myxococcaceae bacterium]|nr:hypothetical protein [Myxococcaceae bacterium]